MKPLLLAGALSLLPLTVQGQDTTASPLASCDGLRITRVDIDPGRPPFGGAASRWRHAARAIGLHHQTTRDAVIEAFMSLRVGQTCTELRRFESERVIRDQPYIATASVQAFADGPGAARLVVTTTDEIGAIIGGRFRGLQPEKILLGNGNVGGLGLRLEGTVERGYAYRTGIGLRAVEFASFGRPYMTTIDVQRRTIGYFADVEMSHPFYSDLQRIGWHAGGITAEDYMPVTRPARDPLALRVQQQRWDLSSLVRVLGTRTVTLLGVGTSGLRISPDSIGLLVSDTGLARDTGSVLRNRYTDFKAVRVGVITGVRRMSFHSVRGFDGLTAQQDVPSGFATGVYLAQGLHHFGENDRFISTASFFGMARDHMSLTSVAQVEARDVGTRDWDSIIGSGKATLYVGQGPGVVLMVEDRFSGGGKSRLPLQLDISDHRGGILGYSGAALAGARRNAGHAELRYSRAALLHDADLGVATFGEIGTVWAGDAPYGTNASRGTVGLSLLGAYPTGSKRIYRVDVGFPLKRGGTGGGKLEIRFSSEDRSQQFLREPDDVTRARTGAVPASLFAWPNR